MVTIGNPNKQAVIASPAPQKNQVKTPLWSIALGIFLAALLLGGIKALSESGPRISLPSFGERLNGTYVATSPDGIRLTLTISGRRYTASIPGGTSFEGDIDQVGETIRFTNTLEYQNGYAVPPDDQGAALGTLSDNGQKIKFQIQNGPIVDFIKQ